MHADRRPRFTPATDPKRHPRHPLIAAGFLALTVAGLAGCHANDPVYFPGPMVLQTDGNGTEAKVTLPLRFRSPTQAEGTERDALGAKLGYEIPWLREDRVHVEIRYTVKNLSTDPDDAGGLFSLLIDGASEYARFDYEAVAAAFEAADEDAPPVGLIQPVNLPILKAGEVYQGIIREDDFHEAAIDLDGMGRFMAPFVSVLINRSEVNPIGLELTPSAPPSDMKPAAPVKWILPALWEITPRFSADRPMSCEFLVRVRDDDGRLWDNGDDEFLPEPVTFVPTVMP